MDVLKLKELKDFMAEVWAVNSDTTRIINIIRLEPEKLRILMHWLGIAPNALFSFFKSTKADSGLNNRLDELYNYSRWKGKVLCNNFYSDSDVALCITRLLLSGYERMTEFVAEYEVVERMTAKNLTEDGLKDAGLYCAGKGPRAAIRGIVWEKTFIYGLDLLNVPSEQYVRSTETDNTKDIGVGKRLVEMSISMSDSSGIATKASAIITNGLQAAKQGIEVIALLDKAGWTCRPEFAKIKEAGIKVYQLHDVPGLYRYLAEGIGMTLTLEECQAAWNEALEARRLGNVN